ncbi:MAG: sigma-54-dependent Fis family transcriptional regulator [Saprospiraceae bacterium]|nr:sigma-54-dependent Fis family transcriptional regulator [Saprospiraceae bacterium]
MNADTPNILIIDDDLAICTSLKLLLKKEGYRSGAVQRPKDVEAAILKNKPDLILLDMNFTIETSGRMGLQLLQQIQVLAPGTPVILITAWATVQLAVEGMKKGARDFMAKPWNNKEMIQSVRTILELERPVAQQKNTVTEGDQQIIGQDPTLLQTIQTAQRISSTDASVLILGESGTGKEVLAEAIHYTSQRKQGPFVRVNLGGISTSLFDSELFGHQKGAFTGAIADREGRFTRANGGTIFLDEIGDLPLPSQVKLLRVLQEKTYEVLGNSSPRRVDCRVISATNKDLETMIQEATFREDLYYRINLIKLVLPPLRERPGDIPLLAAHFVQTFKQAYQKDDLYLSESARAWLRQQYFPGNIRELRNLVERTILVSASAQLEAHHFESNYNPNQANITNPLMNTEGLSLSEMERVMISRAMGAYAGNITKVAQALGITRSALYRRLQKHNIHYEH